MLIVSLIVLLVVAVGRLTASAVLARRLREDRVLHGSTGRHAAHSGIHHSTVLIMASHEVLLSWRVSLIAITILVVRSTLVRLVLIVVILLVGTSALRRIVHLDLTT